MAGEWIPIRTDIFDCPQVVRILSKLCPDSVRDSSERVRQTSTIVGALVRMWSLFDRYTEDGFLKNYSSEVLDQMVGMAGFSAAVVEVGWLVVVENGLQMPEFSKYLSKTAKTRMKDSQRKKAERAASKECPENVQEVSDKNRTTIQENTTEKNLEIKKDSSEPSRSSEPVDNSIVFDCVGKDAGQWNPPLKLIQVFRDAYPHHDVVAELRKAVAWIVANPAKRKTKKGMPAFLNRWMERAKPSTDTNTRQKTQAEKDAILAEARARRAKEDGRDGS